MSNIITVPHTVTFLATINMDTIPAKLIAPLLACSEEQLQEMVKLTTVHALKTLEFAEQANDGGSWASLQIAE